MAVARGCQGGEGVRGRGGDGEGELRAAGQLVRGRAAAGLRVEVGRGLVRQRRRRGRRRAATGHLCSTVDSVWISESSFERSAGFGDGKSQCQAPSVSVRCQSTRNCASTSEWTLFQAEQCVRWVLHGVLRPPSGCARGCGMAKGVGAARCSGVPPCCAALGTSTRRPPAAAIAAAVAERAAARPPGTVQNAMFRGATTTAECHTCDIMWGRQVNLSMHDVDQRQEKHWGQCRSWQQRTAGRGGGRGHGGVGAAAIVRVQRRQVHRGQQPPAAAARLRDAHLRPRCRGCHQKCSQGRITLASLSILTLSLLRASMTRSKAAV